MSPYLPMRAKYAWEMFSDKIKKQENGKKLRLILNRMPIHCATILLLFTEFDRDRVYPTDIKVIVWYNLLIDNNLTDFLKKKKRKLPKRKPDNLQCLILTY